MNDESVYQTPADGTTEEESSLHGVLPVVQMPFHDDESIDFETLTREIDWLYEQGSDGVVLAMVSEVLRLTSEERRRVCEQIVEANRDRGSVVVSVGAESAFAAVDFARHAEDSGATAVMAIGPLSIALSETELVGYFRRIIECVQIPVVVQDASGYVGAPMPTSAMAQLLDRYGPRRVLFKPEAVPIGQGLSQLRDATGGKAAVLEGSGGISLVDSYHRGIVGTMPGADLITAIVALWNALKSNDLSTVDRIAMPLGALVALQTGLDGFLAIEKHLLVRQGVFKNTVVRGPVGFHLDAETRCEADRLFDYLYAELGELR